jgi:hypothetical protein
MRAQGVPESPARVEYTVQFSRGPKGRRRAREASDHLTHREAPACVPKITRLLVLGHHFERLVRDGAVKDYAEIARLTGLTRARVTQIVNLTLLAPQIQDEILSRDAVVKGRDSVTEHDLRAVHEHVGWEGQTRAWKALIPKRTQ